MNKIIVRTGHFDMLHPGEESVSVHIGGLVGFEKPYINLSADMDDYPFLKDADHEYDEDYFVQVFKLLRDNLRFTASSDKTEQQFKAFLKDKTNEELAEFVKPYCTQQHNRRIDELKRKIAGMTAELNVLMKENEVKV